MELKKLAKHFTLFICECKKFPNTFQFSFISLYQFIMEGSIIFFHAKTMNETSGLFFRFLNKSKKNEIRGQEGHYYKISFSNSLSPSSSSQSQLPVYTFD